MKERRIGTFTLGVMLIMFGVLFVINIFNNKMTFAMIAKFWPVLLIMLGIEILVGLYSKEKVKFVYDKGSVAMLILITIFVFIAASTQWCVTKGAQYVDKYYEDYMNRENDYVDGKAMFRNVDEIAVLVGDEETKVIKGKDKDKIVKALKDYDWNKNIVREPKRGDHDIMLDFENNEAMLCLSKESQNVYMHNEEVYGNELDKDTYELIMKAIN